MAHDVKTTFLAVAPIGRRAEAAAARAAPASKVRARINEECPRCSHPEMLFHTAQLRSADEGQTIFYNCERCGHSFSVNS